MVVSEEPLISSEDWVSAGVDGAVKLEGEGETEGVTSGKRRVGETPRIFGGSIKEGDKEMRGQHRRPALVVDVRDDDQTKRINDQIG